MAVDIDIWDETYGHAPTNVVVFSTGLGPRNLPSMYVPVLIYIPRLFTYAHRLGGGDLDGDYFTVIWDPDFLYNSVSPFQNFVLKVSPELTQNPRWITQLLHP